MIRAIAILLLMAVNGWGAEFLIMRVNNWMVDADKTGWTAEQIADADRQYKIGDIVQVFPDGGCPENPCVGSPFFILRVTGLPYADALKYQEQWDEVYQEDTITRMRMKSRRKYGITYDSLPKKIKNYLTSNRYYNTTFTAIRGYIKTR